MKETEKQELINEVAEQIWNASEPLSPWDKINDEQKEKSIESAMSALEVVLDKYTLHDKDLSMQESPTESTHTVTPTKAERDKILRACKDGKEYKLPRRKQDKVTKRLYSVCIALEKEKLLTRLLHLPNSTTWVSTAEYLKTEGE